MMNSGLRQLLGVQRDLLKECLQKVDSINVIFAASKVTLLFKSSHWLSGPRKEIASPNCLDYLSETILREKLDIFSRNILSSCYFLVHVLVIFHSMRAHTQLDSWDGESDELPWRNEDLYQLAGWLCSASGREEDKFDVSLRNSTEWIILLAAVITSWRSCYRTLPPRSSIAIFHGVSITSGELLSYWWGGDIRVKWLVIFVVITWWSPFLK